MTTAAISVSVSAPCPVCQSKSRCLIGESRIICYRKADGAIKVSTDKNGEPTYIHEKPGALPQLSVFNPSAASGGSTAKADSHTIHDVYWSLLQALSLSESHRDSLRKRGLSDAEIDYRKYRTLPHRRGEIIKTLRSTFGERLLSVPGFYAKHNATGSYVTIGGKSGILIPSITRLNDRPVISGIKVRSDDPDPKGRYRFLSSRKYGGPGATQVVHIPVSRDDRSVFPAECIRVTEGELKADIAFVLSGLPTISIPGVSSWRLSIPVLRTQGAKRVRIAFDADATVNPDVARPLLLFARTLLAEGFGVEFERWPIASGKGIDDVLAASKASEIEVLSDDDAISAIVATAASLGIDTETEGDPSREMPNEGTTDPHRLARLLVKQRYMSGNKRTIQCWRGEWWTWNGSRYERTQKDEVTAGITATAKAEVDAANLIALRRCRSNPNSDGAPPEATPVTKSIVSNAMQALESQCVLPGQSSQPFWIDEQPSDPKACELLAMASGLLHVSEILKPNPVSDNILIPKSPRFFSPNSLEYDYDPNADCPRWIEFLNTLWPNDPQSIRCLQEWFGYCLTLDTRHHKILMIVGPARSGKGTINRVLTKLVGDGFVSNPTLSSLAEPFGLWPLLGKTVAVVTDARLSGQSNVSQIVERLLSISGEDPQNIQRKNMTTLTGVRMPLRFVLLSNELPRLSDASGAMASRISLLRTTESFLGREDKTLESTLLSELPGILLWSLAGRLCLEESGSFTVPDASKDMTDAMDELSSPIKSFVRDRCILGPEEKSTAKQLFEEWKLWCERHGREHHGTLEVFARDLLAAVPSIRRTQITEDGNRHRAYLGIRKKLGDSEFDASDASDAF